MDNPFSFIGFFVLFFIAIVFALIKISGWDKLSKKYAYHAKFQGKLFRIVTAYVGIVRYRNSISIGISTHGLYLNPFPIFRLGYPPVLIPWREISHFEIKKGFLGIGHYYLLHIGSPKLTTVTLPPRLFKAFPGIVEHLSNRNNL